ncbi:sulfatase [bacterium]|nr:sulfatase [bacterium]
MLRLVRKGILIGLIIGGISGILESLLVALTAYNLRFSYIPFVYSFDLTGGCLLGLFFGIVLGITKLSDTGIMRNVDKERLSICIIFTGILYVQALIKIGSKLGYSVIFYEAVLCALVVALPLVWGMYKVMNKSRRFPFISFIMLTFITELVITEGFYLHRRYFPNALTLKSIGETLLVFILLVFIYMMFQRLLSWLPVSKRHLTWDRKAVAFLLLFIPAGLIIGVAAYASVQPRFVLTGEKSRQTETLLTWIYSKERPNIVLISIDTLRADRLGVYGYSNNTSPHIDRLAQEGTFFRLAVSQSPWTLPSHASIMTSLYPSQHGANKEGALLDKTFLTLAEALKEEGYNTAAFTGGGWLSRGFGFQQGFCLYDDKAEESLNLEYRPMPAIISFPVFRNRRDFFFSVAKIVQWLRVNAKKEDRFFLFIHTYEVHNWFFNKRRLEPYLDKMGIQFNENLKDLRFDLIGLMMDANEEQLSYMKALYDAEIMYTDNMLGILFDELKSLGLEDNTLIVLTSDHGEGFDPGMKRVHHGGRLHNDQILVPLIIKLPGTIPSNKEIDATVQLIDIVPTILDIANIQMADQFKGRSLLDLILDSNTSRDFPAYSEELCLRFNKQNERESVNNDLYRMVSVIKNGKKLICSPEREEFYDISADPCERSNLITGTCPDAEALNDLIDIFIRTNKPVYNRKDRHGKDVHLDKDTIEKLKSLGYLNSGNLN